MFIDGGEREGETLMWERNINQLPPIQSPKGSLTGDGTHKLLVPGMMLQATEPPGQGRMICLIILS